MTRSLLKTPTTQPGAMVALAGHPRAGAGLREPVLAGAAKAATDEEALAARQRAADELDALRRSARDEGLRQGRLDAQRQVEDAMKRHDAALQALAQGIDAAVRERLDGLEAFALAVAYQACGTVLSHAALNGNAVTSIVGRLLQPLRQPAAVRVQLHPGDLARVAHAFRDDPRQAAQMLRFEADATLGRGDCRVVTPHGQLESGLAVQLGAIQESLLATYAALQPPAEAPL